MILVKKSKEKILITGHALYGDYDKDIVCSAVSSIVITSLNAIIDFNAKAISYKVKSGNIKITIQSFDKITLTLINNMLDLLEKLSTKYPKNIQVKEGV